MEILKRVKARMLVSAIITMGIGVVLLLDPIGVMRTIARVVGVIIVINGGMDVFHFLRDKGKTAFSSASVILAVLKILFGVLIVINASHIISFFSLIFSIVILIFGINSCQHALHLKQAQVKGWELHLVVSVIVVVAGFVLVFDPIGAIGITARIMGIVLVINAINELITLNRMRQVTSDIYGVARDLKAEMDGNIIDVEAKEK